MLLQTRPAPLTIVCVLHMVHIKLLHVTSTLSKLYHRPCLFNACRAGSYLEHQAPDVLMHQAATLQDDNLAAAAAAAAASGCVNGLLMHTISTGGSELLPHPGSAAAGTAGEQQHRQSRGVCLHLQWVPCIVQVLLATLVSLVGALWQPHFTLSCCARQPYRVQCTEL